MFSVLIYFNFLKRVNGGKSVNLEGLRQKFTLPNENTFVDSFLYAPNFHLIVATLNSQTHPDSFKAPISRFLVPV